LRDPAVLTADPIAEYRGLTATYADELLPIQYALHDTRILDSHDITTGAGVTVAVIDSGVSISHSDLQAQGILYKDFIRPGAADTVVGERHGTAVAALIAADARNGMGMVGVAPDARLLALRACWAEDQPGGARCNSYTLARALNFALLNGADVINLSLGGPPDPLIAQLVDLALARGITVVAAHGPGAAPMYPAAQDGVIAARMRATAPGSGSSSDILGFTAPGQDILSARPDGRFDFFSGDSVAAAHVSVLAALLRALPNPPDQPGLRYAVAAAQGAPGVDAPSPLAAVGSEVACAVQQP